MRKIILAVMAIVFFSSAVFAGERVLPPNPNWDLKLLQAQKPEGFQIQSSVKDFILKQKIETSWGKFKFRPNKKGGKIEWRIRF